MEFSYSNTCKNSINTTFNDKENAPYFKSVDYQQETTNQNSQQQYQNYNQSQISITDTNFNKEIFTKKQQQPLQNTLGNAINKAINQCDLLLDEKPKISKNRYKNVNNSNKSSNTTVEFNLSRKYSTPNLIGKQLITNQNESCLNLYRGQCSQGRCYNHKCKDNHNHKTTNSKSPSLKKWPVQNNKNENYFSKNYKDQSPYSNSQNKSQKSLNFQNSNTTPVKQSQKQVKQQQQQPEINFIQRNIRSTSQIKQKNYQNDTQKKSKNVSPQTPNKQSTLQKPDLQNSYFNNTNNNSQNKTKSKSPNLKHTNSQKSIKTLESVYIQKNQYCGLQQLIQQNKPESTQKQQQFNIKSQNQSQGQGLHIPTEFSEIDQNNQYDTSIDQNFNLFSNRKQQENIYYNNSQDKQLCYEQYITELQTQQFLNLHFQQELQQAINNKQLNITINIEKFVNKLFYEFPDILEDHQIQEELIKELNVKIQELLCQTNNQQILCLHKLQEVTKNPGLLGVILKGMKQFNFDEKNKIEEFRQSADERYNGIQRQSIQDLEKISSNNNNNQPQILIKNQDEKNIKNILQEFMESMQREMENEIYKKFNYEMRRLMVKFNETEKLLTLINNKVTDNFDLFKQEAETRKTIKNLQNKHNNLQEINIDLNIKLKELESQLNLKNNSINQIQEENKKLLERCDKYQEQIMVLNKYQLEMCQQNQQIMVSQQQYQMQLSHQVSQRKDTFNDDYDENELNTSSAKPSISQQNKQDYSQIQNQSKFKQSIIPDSQISEQQDKKSPFSKKLPHTTLGTLIQTITTLIHNINIINISTPVIQNQQDCQKYFDKKMYKQFTILQYDFLDLFVNSLELIPLLQNPEISSLQEIHIFLQFIFQTSMFITQIKNQGDQQQNSQLPQNIEQIQQFRIQYLPRVECWQEFLDNKQQKPQIQQNNLKIENYQVINNQIFNQAVLNILKELAKSINNETQQQQSKQFSICSNASSYLEKKRKVSIINLDEIFDKDQALKTSIICNMLIGLYSDDLQEVLLYMGLIKDMQQKITHKQYRNNLTKTNNDFNISDFLVENDLITLLSFIIDKFQLLNSKNSGKNYQNLTLCLEILSLIQNLNEQYSEYTKQISQPQFLQIIVKILNNQEYSQNIQTCTVIYNLLKCISYSLSVDMQQVEIGQLKQVLQQNFQILKQNQDNQSVDSKMIQQSIQVILQNIEQKEQDLQKYRY